MSLEFEKVTFGYGRDPVLSGFSWEVPAGRTALLGPNGAGKSTLMLVGAGAERPWRGSVRAGDSRAFGKRRERTRYRESVGWMPQHARAARGLTGREQVAYSGWLKRMSRADAWASALRCLARVGLEKKANMKASTYSGGQLRRLALAQVLVHNPEVLLLDEPTVGLDPAQRARFREVLADAVGEQSNLTVLISTHQVDDITDMFDRVAVICDGTLLHESPASDFLALGADAEGTKAAERAYASIVGADV